MEVRASTLFVPYRLCVPEAVCWFHSPGGGLIYGILNYSSRQNVPGLKSSGFSHLRTWLVLNQVIPTISAVNTEMMSTLHVVFLNELIQVAQAVGVKILPSG